MRVLVITGDKTFGPGHPRYDLQRLAVDELAVAYWGRGSLWPTVRGSFDVVTTQDPFWRGLFAWYVARRNGAKFNVQIHADLSGQSFIKHVLAQIVLRHADSVRVVSEKIKHQVTRINPHAPITVLPVFVDLSKFTTVVHEPQPRKTILWVGRFEPEKDPLYALRACAEVRKTVDARLIMLGAGSLEVALKSAAKDMPVEFPGWQDPALYLAKAEVVLCTSRHESFGASIVEALAAGVPVVAPDVGVAREAGAIVMPREKMTDALIEVLTTGVRGQLKLAMRNKAEWLQAWKDSLL